MPVWIFEKRATSSHIERVKGDSVSEMLVPRVLIEIYDFQIGNLLQYIEILSMQKNSINSKCIYVEGHFGTQLNELYIHLLKQQCEVKRKII